MSCRNYHTSPACKRAASASGAVAATRNGRIRFDIVCQRCRRMSHCVTHPHIHTHTISARCLLFHVAHSVPWTSLYPVETDALRFLRPCDRCSWAHFFLSLSLYAFWMESERTQNGPESNKEHVHIPALSPSLISHRRQTTSATHCQMPELTIKHLNGRLLINKVVRKCAIRVIFRVTCSTFRLCHRKRINHKLSACKRLVGCVCVCATHQIGYAMSVFVSVFFSILFHWWISIMARGGSVGMRARVKLSVIYDPSPPSCHLCA